MLSNIKKRLKYFIKQNDIIYALDKLLSITDPSSKIYDEIILTYSRFLEYEVLISKGFLSIPSVEINKIKHSIILLINDLHQHHLIMSNNEKPIKKQKHLSRIELSFVLNPFFENDLLNLEGDWSIENLIGNKTLIVIVGSHIFPETFDRAAAYLLQNRINAKGVYEEKKRAIVLTDTQYEIQTKLNSGGVIDEVGEKVDFGSTEYIYGKTYGKDQCIPDLNSLSVVSIGGPTINRVTLDIIKNKNKLYAERGVNIAYQESTGSTRIALWGSSVLKTQESVTEFIQNDQYGLDWLLKKVWEGELYQSE